MPVVFLRLSQASAAIFWAFSTPIGGPYFGGACANALEIAKNQQQTRQNSNLTTRPDSPLQMVLT
jgi:hypothetical protein